MPHAFNTRASRMPPATISLAQWAAFVVQQHVDACLMEFMRARKTHSSKASYSLRAVGCTAVSVAGGGPVKVEDLAAAPPYHIQWSWNDDWHRQVSTMQRGCRKQKRRCPFLWWLDRRRGKFLQGRGGGKTRLDAINLYRTPEIQGDLKVNVSKIICCNGKID
ncbi:hypothetical protein AVEN_57908-1 [Araneus ventricosus]|uniref:Uncharacterized protein n=1 Tax=Araneus ventricosus TaxID=182803 RepID=A0A4Y2KIF9_ARAVE|nr:hypothetical protein AVEN_57908-1 [Araneus ventricosus]